MLRGAGHTVAAMDAAVAGDVPQGAGLSSSAAIEVATIVALDAVSGNNLDALTHVRLAQRADVAEELDRLAIHIEEARSNVAGNGPHGRRLEARRRGHPGRLR